MATLERLRGQVTSATGELATILASVARLENEIERRRVRAPVGGRLGEIVRLAAGAYVKDGDFLAAIVPSGPLTVIARFGPAASLGRVRPGQPARVRFPGFPSTQFGFVTARVSKVGSEAHAGGVRVELELEVDPRHPPAIPLEHALPAEVEVEVERLTPVALVARGVGKWLTEQSAREAAAREPPPSK